jgi:RNA polymerase sigma factor (TIGR02999 family)
MKSVTEILDAAAGGDARAAAELLPLVYTELRSLASARLASEKPGHTLQATALVHEAYLRLVGSEPDRGWNGRGHFFAAAAEAMRRIVVEHARRKKRLKRGGNMRRVDLLPHQPAIGEGPIDVLSLDDVLTRFAAEHAGKAALVTLRFYVGMTTAEAADALGISTATADRHWKFARAWLVKALRDSKSPSRIS